MASQKVWFAKDAVLALGASQATPLIAAGLALAVTTSTWTGRIKNLKIEGAGRDISPINVMGLQQLKQRDRPTIVTCTFNTVMYPMGSTAVDTTLNDFLFGKGAAVTSPSGYNRYQGGEKATDRDECALLITMSRPGAAVTDTIIFLLNNADIVTGDITQDAEDHTQQEWVVKCLASDFWFDTGVTADPAS